MKYNRRSFFTRLGLAVAALHIGKIPLPVAPPVYTLTLVSSPVVAKVTKLKAQWTMECEQDLVAFHGIRAEDALLNL